MRPLRRRLLTAAALAPAGGALTTLSGCAQPAPAADAERRWPYPTLTGAAPLVIAHRGASGERPEHTLAAYALAIDQGADFIELDLVSTRDGVLVARHDLELSATTDVARHPEFAARRRTRTIDGRTATGWFVDDFDAGELATLRARERWPQRRPQSAAFDGRFPIATLAQAIDLVRARRAAGRQVGLYLETKSAAHFAAQGLALEPPLAAALAAAGWRDAAAPVWLQSFEAASLQRLAQLTALRRVQLVGVVGARQAPDAAALRAIAAQAQALGAAQELVVGSADDASATALVAQAHAAGLAVHAWTFRREPDFLPPAWRDRPDEALLRLLATGVDGVFCDQPGAAVQLRRRLLASD